MRAMEPLLYLVHRMPFPPNKGDKIRSYHLLRHLAERYAVHLGTFVDMPEDFAHVPQLEALCASHHVETLDPRAARLRSVSGFLTGEALTLPYYRNATLQAWVRRTVRAARNSQGCRLLGAMAQYVSDLAGLRVVLDFVDVDSAKWSEYAQRHSRGRRRSSIAAKARSCWPSSAAAAERSAANVFVTRGEADLFLRLAPGSRAHACT